MSASPQEASRVVLSLLQETWDDASTSDLTNTELAAVLELWLFSRDERSTLLSCVVERLRTSQR